MLTTYRTNWLLGLCALVSISTPGMAQDKRSTLPELKVPARVIPVPTTVSPELQKSIASPIAPIVEMPATAEGWKRLQKTADSQAEQRVKGFAGLLGVKVEPVKLAGVSCYKVTPKTIAPGKEKQLLFHVHGGAYVFNGGLAATGEAILLAHTCQMPAISVDYRMPPDHPFPAAPDDVLAVWKHIIKEYDPKMAVMGGTSAGGGLIMTTMLRCKEEKLPMPAAIFLGTPGADLTKTGDTMFLNAEVDHLLGRYEGRIEACLKLYANGKDLKDPLLSPIYGDLAGFPPTILITGTRDLLLSATARTHRKLRVAGVPAEIHVFEGICHAEYLTSYPSPESKECLAEIARFFDRYLK